MSDLKTRLRQMVLPRGYSNTLLIQAADHIAELEGTIKRVEEQLFLMPQSGSGYDYWIGAIRRAIKEQTDE